LKAESSAPGWRRGKTSPVKAIEVGEDAGDAGRLVAVEAGGFVGGGGAADQGGEDGMAEVGVFDDAGEESGVLGAWVRIRR